MPKYTMDVTIYGTVRVEADSPEEAKALAQDGLRCSEVQISATFQTFGEDIGPDQVELSDVGTITCRDEDWQDTEVFEED